MNLRFLLAAACLTAQDARDLFQKQCSVCHGDGHGTERGPNLANNRKVRAASNTELLAIIRDGVPSRGMPTFALPPSDLEALTKLVRSLSAPASDSAVTGDIAKGKAHFDRACTGCHMVFGKGGLNGPDLSNVGHELTIEELTEAVQKPAARIKIGYQMATVRLKTGQSLRGFVRNQSRYNIQLQDNAGRFHLLSREETSQWPTA